MRRLVAWIVRLWRGSRAVVDLNDYPVPLYLRRSAGLGPPAPPRVVKCSGCGVRYFERAAGAFLPEDGRCRGCASKVGRAAVTQEEAVALFKRQRRHGGWRR